MNFRDGHGWRRLESLDFSNDANLDFFVGINIQKKINFVINDLVIDTDNVILSMRVSTNGSSFLSGGSDYSWAMDGSANGVDAHSFDIADDEMNLVHETTLFRLGSAAGEIYSGDVLLKNPGDTTAPKHFHFTSSYLDSTATARINQYSGNGIYKGTNSPIVGVQFRISSGLIVSGNIESWGLR